MKKKHIIPFVFFSVIIFIISFGSCVNPVSPDISNIEYPNWPSSATMARFGFFNIPFPKGAENVTYSYSNDQQSLFIYFTGGAETQEQVLDYFSAWEREDYPDSVGFSRGISDAYVNIAPDPAKASKKYFEIGVTRYPGAQGWPENLLADYNIPGLNKPSGTITDLSYNIGITDNPLTGDRVNELTIRIYGESKSADGIFSYFNSNAWLPYVRDPGDEPLQEGEKEYSFGSMLLARLFGRNNPKYPPYYYEISVTKELAGIAGWPGKSMLDFYGLYDIWAPSGELTPGDFRYYEEEGTGSDGITKEKSLNFMLYGTSNNVNDKGFLIIDPNTEDDLLNYFNNGTWKYDAASSTETIKAYTRGLANVSFDTSFRPYYEFNSTRNPKAVDGWPSPETRKTFNLDSVTQPSGSRDMSYAVEKADETVNSPDALSIWFFGNSGSELEINNRFNTWCVEESTAPGVYEYSKGIFTASFDTECSPFYELIATIDPSLTQGWPGSLAAKYGFADWTSNTPDTAGATFMAYTDSFETDDNGNTTNLPQLFIRFVDDTGSKTAKASVLNYFKAKWCKEESTDTVLNYSRGMFNASIYLLKDAAGNETHFEIIFTTNTECKQGWPGSDKDKYGNGAEKFGKPSGSSIDYITWAEDMTDPFNIFLTIKFYWDDTPSAVANTVFASPSWKRSEDPITHEVTYIRGPTNATIESVDLDESDDTYYEITLTKEQGWTNGLPSPALRGAYNLEDLSLSPWNFGTNEDFVAHAELNVTDDNDVVLYESDGTPRRQLSIRYFGTSPASVTKVNSYFESAWCVDDLIDGVYSYNRGIFSAAFDTSEDPNFDITFDKNPDFRIGWPTTELKQRFRINSDWPQDDFGNLDSNSIAYSIVPDEEDGLQVIHPLTNELLTVLTVRFSGSASTKTNVYKYFNDKWCMDTPFAKTSDSGITTETSAYSRGDVTVSLTVKYSSTTSYSFEIEFSRSLEHVNGWPTSTLKQKFRFDSDWPQSSLRNLVSDSIAYSIEDDLDDGNNQQYHPKTGELLTVLSVRFSGLANTKTDVNNYFNEKWCIDTPLATAQKLDTASGITITTETTEYSRGDALASLTVKYTSESSTNYSYEIAFSRNPEYINGWPADSTLKAYYAVSDWPPSTFSGYVSESIAYTVQPDEDDNGVQLIHPVTLEPLNKLSYRFSGTSTTRTNVFAHFGKWCEEAAPATDLLTNIEKAEYSKGIIQASVTISRFTSYSTDYLFEIDFSEDTDVEEGWPDPATRAFYGLTETAWNTPPSSSYICNFIDTEDGDSLSIRFYPSSTLNISSFISTYFASANGWTKDPDEPLLYVYSKKEIYSAEIKAISAGSNNTYYEISVSVEGTIGTSWPGSLLTGYGLNSSASSQPSNIDGTSIAYIKKTDGLILSFTGTGSSSNLTSLENTIKGYFNAWREVTAPVAPSGNNSGTKGEYSRGIYDVTYTIGVQSGSGSNLRRDYTIDIAEKENCGSNWPLLEQAWIDANVGDIYISSGPAGTATPYGYCLTEDGLLIWFGGTATTLTNAKALFSKANGWVYETATPNEYNYGPYVAEFFATSNNSYFEIEIYKDSTVTFKGWPSSQTLSSYGHGSFTMPTGATFIDYDTSVSNEIEISFWGTSSTVAAVHAYLMAQAGLGSIPSPSSNIYTYDLQELGEAQFDISMAPYYVLSLCK